MVHALVSAASCPGIICSLVKLRVVLSQSAHFFEQTVEVDVYDVAGAGVHENVLAMPITQTNNWMSEQGSNK